jgi:carboxyl-terminal processing protease
MRAAFTQMRREGVTGLILDLRGNTGGYLDVTLEICRMLVPRGIILQTVGAAGRTRTFSSHLNAPPFGTMVVLTDRYTASAAEVIASALQDSGAAIVVGERTYGKGVIQSFFVNPSGGALRLTTEEYFTRNGNAINNVGITPDVEVARDNRQNHDGTLEKALEIILRR